MSDQAAAAQAEEALEMLPRGTRAIGLLIEARSLAQAFMSRPGVGREQLEQFIAQVDALLGPIHGPSSIQVIEGNCPKCGRHWEVRADERAVVSVLAFQCTCGHVTR